MYEATVILLTCRVEFRLVQPFLDTYSLAASKAKHANVPSISTPGYVPNSVCFTKYIFLYMFNISPKSETNVPTSGMDEG